MRYRIFFHITLLLLSFYSYKAFALSATNDSVPEPFSILLRDDSIGYSHSFFVNYGQSQLAISANLINELIHSNQNIIKWDLRSDKNQQLDDTITAIIATKFKKNENTVNNFKSTKSLLVKSSGGFNILTKTPNVLQLFESENQIEKLQYLNLPSHASIPKELGYLRKLKSLEIRQGPESEEIIMIEDTSLINNNYKENFLYPIITNNISLCQDLENLKITGYFQTLPNLRKLENLTTFDWKVLRTGPLLFKPIENETVYEVSYQKVAQNIIWEAPKGLDKLIKLNLLKIRNPILEIPDTYSNLKQLRKVVLHSQQKMMPKCIKSWNKLEEMAIVLPNVSKQANFFKKNPELRIAKIHSGSKCFAQKLWEHDGLETAISFFPKIRYLNLDGNKVGKRMEWVEFYLDANIKYYQAFSEFTYHEYDQKRGDLRAIKVKNMRIPIYFYAKGNLPFLQKIDIKKVACIEAQLGGYSPSKQLDKLKRIRIKDIDSLCVLELNTNLPSISTIECAHVENLSLQITGEMPNVQKIHISNSNVTDLIIESKITNFQLNISVDDSILENAFVKIVLHVDYDVSTEQELQNLLTMLTEFTAKLKTQKLYTPSVVNLVIDNYSSVKNINNKNVKESYHF